MFFFFQAEDGIRDLVRSRGLGDVYKRQLLHQDHTIELMRWLVQKDIMKVIQAEYRLQIKDICLLYTSDAADERSSVDLGGRRIIKKKIKEERVGSGSVETHNNT